MHDATVYWGHVKNIYSHTLSVYLYSLLLYIQYINTTVANIMQINYTNKVTHNMWHFMRMRRIWVASGFFFGAHSWHLGIIYYRYIWCPIYLCCRTCYIIMFVYIIMNIFNFSKSERKDVTDLCMRQKIFSTCNGENSENTSI